MERQGLKPARTHHSDEGGVFVMQQADKGLHVRTQTLGGGAVDWAYQSAALAKGMGFIYTKTALFPLPHTATPQLDIEIGGTAGELIFWAALTPRLDVVGHPDYAQRYYSSPPRAGALPFVELERVAALRPEYKRFVSPAIMVRALSATALPFTAAPSEAALAGMLEDALAVTDLWLSWVDVDAEQQQRAAAGATEGAAAGGMPPTGPPHPDLAARYPEALSSTSAAMRDIMRRDPALPPQRAVFGDAAIERWLETMSGQARRL